MELQQLYPTGTITVPGSLMDTDRAADRLRQAVDKALCARVAYLTAQRLGQFEESLKRGDEYGAALEHLQYVSRRPFLDVLAAIEQRKGNAQVILAIIESIEPAEVREAA